MASQVKTITSESLEAAYRSYTPSQSGFTEDLMASNTIIPVVDLTADAGGSASIDFRDVAWDFATIFVRQRGTGTTNVTNTPGFYKVMVAAAFDAGGTSGTTIQISDGLSTKTIWAAPTTGAGSNPVLQISNLFYVFLRSGDSLNAIGASGDEIVVSARQVADVSGNLIDPLGYQPQ